MSILGISVTDLSSIATIIAAMAALISVILLFFQIKGAHQDNLKQLKKQALENKKWWTLNICAQYELNSNICDAAKKLRIAFKDGSRLQNGCSNEDRLNEICNAAKIVLNYLDGIAIGVKQGLYLEELARDHLKEIVDTQVSRLLLSEENRDKLRLEMGDFRFVVAMSRSWTENSPYFRDES